MAKIQYIQKNFRAKTKELLDYIVDIVEEYENRGYYLTVRQVYYQLVSRDIIQNDLNSYQHISRVLTDARMTGLVDWDTIEDRARQAIMPMQYDSISSFIRLSVDSYRRYRWEDQNHYVEVIVEKEALSGILRPLTTKYNVLLLSNKGYSSASAIHDAAQRIIRHTSQGKKCHILYLGDHDPSGNDMVRDIRDRLDKLRCIVSVEKIALTMKQIEQYKPPPNPAKKSDPRSEKYVTEYGDQSWELDALKPEALNELVESNIKKYLDMDKYKNIVEKERREKLKLVELCRVVDIMSRRKDTDDDE